METLRKIKSDTDFEVRSLDPVYINEPEKMHPWWHHAKFLIAGIFFGVILVKAELVSWFRMQEMFRFQSFHLFGIMMSAIAVGIICIQLIKTFQIKTVYGEPIMLPKKKFHRGQIFGGLIFGAGWAITGACPGPLFAQIGTGLSVVIITLLSAVAGTWVYGLLRERLPH